MGSDTSILPAAGTAPAVVSSPPPARLHVPSLDGLRGLAVLGVVSLHAGVPGTEMGFLGVDLFFVLSGFLITTLLAREVDRSGRVDLGKFWGRRFLRLGPAYAVYVGSLSVALLAGFGRRETHDGWTPLGYLASLWGYYSNYLPNVGIWQHQWLSLHLWSLAIEEQFYLIWPILCAVALPRKRGEVLGWLMVAAVMLHRHLTPGYLTSHLDTRGVGIVLGCAVALTSAVSGRPRMARALSSTGLRWGVVLLLLAAFLGLWAAKRTTPGGVLFLFRSGIPALDLGFALLVAMLWRGPADGLTRALAWRPLAALGTISYGVYLYHMAAHMLVWDVLTTGLDKWPRFVKFPTRMALYLGLSVGIASASYRFLERPFLRLKERLR